MMNGYGYLYNMYSKTQSTNKKTPPIVNPKKKDAYDNIVLSFNNLMLSSSINKFKNKNDAVTYYTNLFKQAMNYQNLDKMSLDKTVLLTADIVDMQTLCNDTTSLISKYNINSNSVKAFFHYIENYDYNSKLSKNINENQQKSNRNSFNINNTNENQQNSNSGKSSINCINNINESQQKSNNESPQNLNSGRFFSDCPPSILKLKKRTSYNNPSSKTIKTDDNDNELSQSMNIMKNNNQQNTPPISCGKPESFNKLIINNSYEE